MPTPRPRPRVAARPAAAALAAALLCLTAACGGSATAGGAGGGPGAAVIRLKDPGNAGVLAYAKREGILERRLRAAGARVEWGGSYASFTATIDAVRSGSVNVLEGAVSPRSATWPTAATSRSSRSPTPWPTGPRPTRTAWSCPRTAPRGPSATWSASRSRSTRAGAASTCCCSRSSRPGSPPTG
ncbi:hypothetical protein ACFQHO_45265 [Actinomadura yumaensis]|uniref:hypothetical protein n=1 Tax=Actinomadura yumaensis TaxID=111807 RepID=UPI00361E821E